MDSTKLPKSISDKFKDLYFGEECSVVGLNGGVPQGYSGIIRLYDAKTGKLVARTFVPNPTGSLRWESDQVGMTGGNDEGVTWVGIRLPPSAWDRFQAALP